MVVVLVVVGGGDMNNGGATDETTGTKNTCAAALPVLVVVVVVAFGGRDGSILRCLSVYDVIYLYLYIVSIVTTVRIHHLCETVDRRICSPEYTRIDK